MKQELFDLGLPSPTVSFLTLPNEALCPEGALPFLNNSPVRKRRKGPLICPPDHVSGVVDSVLWRPGKCWRVYICLCTAKETNNSLAFCGGVYLHMSITSYGAYYGVFSELCVVSFYHRKLGTRYNQAA